MDENNLPPEAGLDAHAVSYNKGCYIGQEILNRIHSFGQVAKALASLRFADIFRAYRLGAISCGTKAKKWLDHQRGRFTAAQREPRFGLPP